MNCSSPAANGTQTIRLVLIEDYHLTRMGFKAILERNAQIQVIGEAENAETGFFVIREKEPDMVLMDLGLPGMDGIEAIRQVKRMVPDLHVMVLSSHADPEDVTAAMAAGANGYCVKDIAPEQLIEAIFTVCKGDTWLDPALQMVVPG